MRCEIRGSVVLFRYADRLLLHLHLFQLQLKFPNKKIYTFSTYSHIESYLIVGSSILFFYHLTKQWKPFCLFLPHEMIVEKNLRRKLRKKRRILFWWQCITYFYNFNFLLTAIVLQFAIGARRYHNLCDSFRVLSPFFYRQIGFTHTNPNYRIIFQNYHHSFDCIWFDSDVPVIFHYHTDQLMTSVFIFKLLFPLVCINKLTFYCRYSLCKKKRYYFFCLLPRHSGDQQR